MPGKAIWAGASALALGTAALLAPTTFAASTGNGAPSGPHYNLNIIGTADKTAAMDDTNRHTIFVGLNKADQKILLTEWPEYTVFDGNATDGDAAEFGLPKPDPEADGTTRYSVFARALGTPGGGADMTTCGTDTDGQLECSVAVLELRRSTGRSSFTNVSGELLYVYQDIDEDGDVDRVPLFDSRLEDYFWDYDNRGLRLAQLRFYECSTQVADPSTVDDTNDPTYVSDTCGRTGK